VATGGYDPPCRADRAASYRQTGEGGRGGSAGNGFCRLDAALEPPIKLLEKPNDGPKTRIELAPKKLMRLA